MLPDFGAVVEVDEVEVDDVDDVEGTATVVVVATPSGSTIMNCVRAFRATAGGWRMAVPFGRKAIVISSPFFKGISFALSAATIVPFVEVGDGQVSTSSWAAVPPHFSPAL